MNKPAKQTKLYISRKEMWIFLLVALITGILISALLYLGRSGDPATISLLLLASLLDGVVILLLGSKVIRQTRKIEEMGTRLGL